MDQSMNMNPSTEGAAPAVVATKSHTWVAVLITVLVLSLGAAGAAWGFLRYSSSSEAKILASFEKLGAVKTLALDGNIHVDGQMEDFKSQMQLGTGSTSQPDLTPVAGDLTFRGKMDMTVKGKGASDMSFGLLLKEGETTYPDFNIDVLSKEKSMAFRIPSIPVVEGFDLTEYNNEWISFDGNKFSEDFAAFLPPEASAKLNELEKNKEKEKIVENLKKSAALHPPIKVTKKLKTEKISGEKTQPYVFVLNRTNAQMIVEQMAKFEKETGVTKRDVEDFKEAMKSIKKFDGTIWVGTKTGLPYRLKLSVQNVDAKKQVPVNISVLLNLKEFNKPVSVNLPTGSTSIEDVITKAMSKLMGPNMGMLNSDTSFASSTDLLGLPDSNSFDLFATSSGSLAPAQSASPTQDTDSDGLSDFEEQLYGTSITSKDTDGDGYSDKTEVESGHDPLKKG